MSATMAFATKIGGGVVIEYSRVVASGRVLRELPGLRADLRDDLRRQIIQSLAKESNLPFALAITNIVKWEEVERDMGGAEDFAVPPDMRRVVLVTRCTVREVRYPAKED